ncbi:MAG: DUF58 domain-containing protein [Algisphaera sp.]
MNSPRVQYRPSSGGAVYALVLGLVATTAIYSQSNLLFAALGLMIGGLVFSIAWAWASLRGLQVHRSFSPNVSAGNPLVLRYRLHNRGRLPAFAVVLRETWQRDLTKTQSPLATASRVGDPSVTWALHIGAKRGVRIQSRCRPRRRGLMTLDHLELSSTCPFGVLRKTLRFSQPATVLVLPRLYRLNPDLLRRLTSTAQGMQGPSAAAGGGDEFYGLRDYRQGDPRNAIDWKRSARTNHLVVRELTRTEPPSLAVRLDLHALPKDESQTPQEHSELKERAISLAASLLCDAHRAGLRVSLQVEGQPAPAMVAPGHTPHLAALLAALARVDTHHAPPQVTDTRPSSTASQVVIWTGVSSAPPPRRGGRVHAITFLGSADFAQHLAATSAPAAPPQTHDTKNPILEPPRVPAKGVS